MRVFRFFDEMLSRIKLFAHLCRNGVHNIDSWVQLFETKVIFRTIFPQT
jgi:hypothetical protein